MELYGQRNAPPPTRLRYDVPREFRGRILAIFNHYVGKGGIWNHFLNQLEGILLRQYGSLKQPSYDAGRMSDDRVIEHFYSCHDKLALEFIEACFRLDVYCGAQDAVNEINDAFRREGIGYQLSSFVTGPKVPGDIRHGPPISDGELPCFHRVDSLRIHRDVVAPALEVLATSKFEVANRELLKAHSDHRTGRHEDAITACVSAFESVLKTICSEKNWSYDANKDTCSKLVDVCKRNKLFPSFYVEQLKSIGTVRNKLGDAHGRGPHRHHSVDGVHAEHLINMTSAHIIFLCKLADMA